MFCAKTSPICEFSVDTKLPTRYIRRVFRHISPIMGQFSQLDLILASRLLHYRLSRPTTIDVNILDPTKADSPAGLNDLYGRFIGFFAFRANKDPCFMLFGRSDPTDDISHAFVFYLNSGHRIVQAPERAKLKPRLCEDVQLSVINVISQAPRFCDLSILLQAVSSQSIRTS